MLIAALSTEHKIGLALVAGLFIGFALLSSFVFPRYRSDYPGRMGLPVFVAATVVLFLGMMGAGYVFGREPKEAKAGAAPETTQSTQSTETQSTTTAETTATTTTATATTSAGATTHKVAVAETEFKIKLAQTSFSPGSYEFDLKNDGKIPHDLTVKGPGISKASTPVIGGGKSAKLRVRLEKGEYELYCSVPGHKQLGMDLKIKVG